MCTGGQTDRQTERLTAIHNASLLGWPHYTPTRQTYCATAIRHNISDIIRMRYDMGTVMKLVAATAGHQHHVLLVTRDSIT